MFIVGDVRDDPSMARTLSFVCPSWKNQQNTRLTKLNKAGMNFYFCRVSPESRFRTFSLSSFFLAPFGAGLTQSEYPDACDTVCVKCFSLTHLSLVLFLEVCASNDQLQTLANLQSLLGSNGSSTSVNRGWVKTRSSQDRAKLSKRYWLALCAIKHEWLSIYRYQLVRFQPNTLLYRSTSRRTLHTSTKMQQTFRIYRYDTSMSKSRGILPTKLWKHLCSGVGWVKQRKWNMKESHGTRLNYKIDYISYILSICNIELQSWITMPCSLLCDSCSGARIWRQHDSCSQTSQSKWWLSVCSQITSWQGTSWSQS